jgi:plastocyanin
MALKAVFSSVRLRATALSRVALNYDLSFVSLNAANVFLDADSKNLIFGSGHPNAIVINLAESAAISFSTSAADSLGLSDSPALGLSRPVSDALSVAESFSKIVTYSRTFADTPTISESTALTLATVQSDTTTILESEAKAVGKAVDDSPSGSDQTFTVTVVSTDSGNKYYIDGVQQATVALTVGATYTFDQSHSSNSGHPLRLSTTSNGTHGGGSAYTTNVTTNGSPGSSGAYTRIQVTASTPSILYYYCSIHSGMGGQANISALGDLSVSESLARVVSYVRALSDAYTLDDTASASDELQTDTNMQKGNVFSVSDAPALTTEPGLSDTQSIAEQAALTVAKAIADTLTMSEASLVGSGAIVSDTSSLSEAIQSLSSSKSLSDSATISESLSILFVSGASSVLNTAALNTSVLN